MRAIICRELGGIDLLELGDMQRPSPGAGEVRVTVCAAGLNFADLLMIKGAYQEKPALPFVPGFELCGRIESIGANVEGLTPGQRVISVVNHGAFAEEVVVPAKDVVPLPDDVDDVTAASLPIAYGTAYGSLQWIAPLRPAETVVVHGAGGGVGLATVACAKALGAFVIATARGDDHLAVAKAMGADVLLDTNTADLRADIKALTDGRGADMIVDPIGGDVFRNSLRALAWGGRMLVIGFASGDIPAIPANLLLVKNISVHGFYWGSYRTHDPARVNAAFETLLGWQAQGRIKPHISMVAPLAESREAMEALRQRRSTGKVVLTMTCS